MKTIRYLPVLLALGLLCGGCASPSYLGDRGRDLGDIFTAEAGYGLGTRIKAGPLHAGLCYVFTPVGLSNGELLWLGRTEEECPCYVDLVCKGIEYSPRGQNRGKDYIAGWGRPFVTWPQRIGLDHSGKALWPHPSYTDFKVTLGIGPAATLGFNPGELLDFFLGWFGVDMYHDDLRNRAKDAKAGNL